MKIMKNSRSTIPSLRVNAMTDAPSRRGVLPITRRASEERITSGISLVMMLRSTFIGMTIAVTPIMTRILNILLPTTLPIASSALPWIADMRLMTNSGAEVPNATTVSPIMRSETPQRFAIADAPSVRIFAPTRISASPNMRKRCRIS